jgi:hypothetical protein
VTAGWEEEGQRATLLDGEGAPGTSTAPRVVLQLREGEAGSNLRKTRLSTVSPPERQTTDRGAKAGRDSRGCGKREEGRSAASHAGGRKGEKKWGGGAAVGVPRGTGAAWGLAPTGGRRPDRVPADRGPATARAGGASLFGQRRAGADTGAPVVVRAERRARAWAGPRRKRGGQAQMNSMILDLFKLIQMSSN